MLARAATLRVPPAACARLPSLPRPLGVSGCTTRARTRAPSMAQWKTALPVTSATVEAETHFQKTTGSGICTDFIFDFISRLKIWR